MPDAPPLARPTHYKASAGKALCEVADYDSSPALPGEWLTDQRAEVTCHVCTEWLHA